MPEEHHTHRTYAWAIIFLLAILAAVFVWQVYFSSPPPLPVATLSIPKGFPKDAPAPTRSDFVSAQKGFQYLVSYTVIGFQPANLIVNKGETVRFTNNASGLLQIALADTRSPVITHGEYWEYTFTNAGTTHYVNGTGSTGTITVK